jgi:hypothetical protein
MQTLPRPFRLDVGTVPWNSACGSLKNLFESILLAIAGPNGARARDEVWSLRPPLPLVAVLWDISQSGARIAVANPEALPDEFAILFSRDDPPAQGVPRRLALWTASRSPIFNATRHGHSCVGRQSGPGRLTPA